MKNFDLEAAKNGAKVVTREGQEVVILKTDLAKTDYPVMGYITYENGYQSGMTWTKEGKAHMDDETEFPSDLFMKTTKNEGWINIFGDYTTGIYISSSEEEARKTSKNPDAIVATIKIEWEI